MTPQHPIESELDSPTPRAVRYRDGFAAGCLVWAGRLVLLPHTLVGVFLLVMALADTGQYVRVLVAGTECEGQVLRKTATKGGKGGWSYAVDYTFRVNEAGHGGHTTVGHDAYDTLAEGDPVSVRALESDPDGNHWVRLPGKSAALEAFGPWFIALFWNGIMAIVLWPTYGRPWRQRRLVRLGQAAAGVIRDVAERKSKPRSWWVTYSYSAPDPDGLTATPRIATMVVNRLPALERGTPVTVLYDPARPTRSVVYALTPYRAV